MRARVSLPVSVDSRGTVGVRSQAVPINNSNNSNNSNNNNNNKTYNKNEKIDE